MITSEQLAAIAGIALSLLTFYIPGLSDKYESLGKQAKAQAMGAMLIIVSAVIFALGYFHIGPITLPPGDLSAQIWQAALTLASALVGNQSTFVLVKAAGNK